MFGVSLDGPQPVIVMEYCTGGIKSTQLTKIHHNSSFDCEENFNLTISQNLID
jgi:hypothetical protein